jgi:hypothetical protein
MKVEKYSVGENGWRYLITPESGEDEIIENAMQCLKERHPEQANWIDVSAALIRIEEIS